MKIRLSKIEKKYIIMASLIIPHMNLYVEVKKARVIAKIHAFGNFGVFLVYKCQWQIK